MSRWRRKRKRGWGHEGDHHRDHLRDGSPCARRTAMSASFVEGRACVAASPPGPLSYEERRSSYFEGGCTPLVCSRTGALMSMIAPGVRWGGTDRDPLGLLKTETEPGRPAPKS